MINTGFPKTVKAFPFNIEHLKSFFPGPQQGNRLLRRGRVPSPDRCKGSNVITQFLCAEIQIQRVIIYSDTL